MHEHQDDATLRALFPIREASVQPSGSPPPESPFAHDRTWNLPRSPPLRRLAIRPPPSRLTEDVSQAEARRVLSPNCMSGRPAGVIGASERCGAAERMPCSEPLLVPAPNFSLRAPPDPLGAAVERGWGWRGRRVDGGVQRRRRGARRLPAARTPPGRRSPRAPIGTLPSCSLAPCPCAGPITPCLRAQTPPPCSRSWRRRVACSRRARSAAAFHSRAARLLTSSRQAWCTTATSWCCCSAGALCGAGRGGEGRGGARLGLPGRLPHRSCHPLPPPVCRCMDRGRDHKPILLPHIIYDELNAVCDECNSPGWVGEAAGHVRGVGVGVQ